MVAQSVPIDAALDAYGRIQFGIADILRRAQGDAFAAFGLDPNEYPCQVIASGPFWRLRNYTKHKATQSLLIGVLGDIDPAEMLAIMSLRPTIADIEQASVWLEGDLDVFGAGEAIQGVASEIIAILRENEEEEPHAG